MGAAREMGWQGLPGGFVGDSSSSVNVHFNCPQSIILRKGCGGGRETLCALHATRQTGSEVDAPAESDQLRRGRRNLASFGADAQTNCTATPSQEIPLRAL